MGDIDEDYATAVAEVLAAAPAALKRKAPLKAEDNDEYESDDGDDSCAAAPSSSSKKRVKYTDLTAEQKLERCKGLWETVLKNKVSSDATKRAQFASIKTDDTAKKTFLESGRLHCSACSSSFSAASNLAHCVKAHSSIQEHANALAANKQAAVSKVFGQSSLAKISVADQAKVNADLHELREISHALGITLCSRNALSKLYGNKSTLYKGVQVLYKYGYTFGVAGTVANDCHSMLPKLKAAVGQKLKGKFGALVVDAATAKKRGKPMAVVFVSSELPEALLLSLVWPVGDPDTGVYSAKLAAQDIRQVCDTVGLGSTPGSDGISPFNDLVTCLVGDNVTFNDRLADELGLERAKCIAHALALVIKAFFSKLPLATTLSLATGSVIYAGGTEKRAQELKAAGLDPSRMRGYANRFYDVANVVHYNLEHYADVKGWATGSQLLQSALGELEDEETLGEDEDEEQPAARLSKVIDAWKDPMAHVVLKLTDSVIFDAVALVRNVSGEGGSVWSDLEGRMASFRGTLEGVMQDSEGCVALSAQALSLPKLGTAQAKRLAQDVKAAATAALAKYEKHMPPALAKLRRRFRFDPRNKPEAAPPMGAMKEFFGCYPSLLGIPLLAQYNSYVQEWAALPRKAVQRVVPSAVPGHADEEEEVQVVDVEPAVYWRNKMKVWPQLATIARYWIEFPTSSVSAERVFAVMRAMETAAANRRLDSSFAEELMFRCNGWLLEELSEKKQQALSAASTAAASFAVTSSSGAGGGVSSEPVYVDE